MYYKLILLIFTTNLFFTSSQSLADKIYVDPIGLYGDEIYFDVLREEDKVGFHRVKFSEELDGLKVQINFKIEIDFLFLTAYQFKYQSEAKWADGQLDQLKIKVDDDGDEFELTANRQNNLIHVVGTNETFKTTSPLFPTNHWNAAVLGQTRVLNTLTGKINNVSILSKGIETVSTKNGPIKATRYVYSGDLDNEVWYDDLGRWVKMRFKASDGSTINYVCKSCQKKNFENKF